MSKESIVVNNIRYETSSPSKELNDLVVSYWRVVVNDKSQELNTTLDVLPKPGATIVIKVNESSREVYPILVGPHLRRFETELNRGESCWIIALKPGATFNWLNVSGAEIRDKVFPLGKINNMLSDRIERIFRLGPSFDALNEVLIPLKSNGKLDPRLDMAINLLVASNGLKSISEVSMQVGMNNRQLQRKFKEVIGFSPKKFARVLRLNSAIKHFRYGRDSNWTEIALEESYYDQAHLSREFRDLMAMKPSELT